MTYDLFHADILTSHNKKATMRRTENERQGAEGALHDIPVSPVNNRNILLLFRNEVCLDP